MFRFISIRVFKAFFFFFFYSVRCCLWFCGCQHITILSDSDEIWRDGGGFKRISSRTGRLFLNSWLKGWSLWIWIERILSPFVLLSGFIKIVTFPHYQASFRYLKKVSLLVFSLQGLCFEILSKPLGHSRIETSFRSSALKVPCNQEFEAVGTPSLWMWGAALSCQHIGHPSTSRFNSRPIRLQVLKAQKHRSHDSLTTCLHGSRDSPDWGIKEWRKDRQTRRQKDRKLR